MEPTGDPVLTAWAADCAEHVLGQFPDFADAAAGAAITAARGWAAGTATLDECRDAALAAHRSARELADSGYRAQADGVRAAGNAAASVDDPTLAETAADYAIDALGLNSAGCERPTNLAAERRWQWLRLDEPQRGRLFPEEPPEPGPASCAI